MTRSAESTAGLTQRQADILGLQFNSAVTSTLAYGPDHPVSDRACGTFLSSLATILETLGSGTLMLDRGALFFEDFPVAGKFNPARLVRTFRELGLQSITFEADPDGTDFRTLMNIMRNADDFDGIDSVKAELAASDVTSFRVNHVILKKFTADDEVISRRGLENLTELAEKSVSSAPATASETPEPGAGTSNPTGPVLARIQSLFTLRDLINQPDELAGQWARATVSAEHDQVDVVSRIRDLASQVSEGKAEDGEQVSLQSVIEALYQVRREMGETLAGQKEVARLMAETGGVLSEVDQLTYQTIVSIVREEHRSGETSARRLAQIIRRMLPDARDLKRLLPQLKEGLLAEGMKPAEYSQFVNELTADLQNDDLAQVLEEGADSIGLSVDEIVREIRQDPGEAARLVILAAELRQSGRPDQNILSDALADYIERISGQMACNDAGQTTGDTREAVSRTQATLIQQVRSQGLPAEVVSQVESRLAEEAGEPEKVAETNPRASRIVELLRESRDLPDARLAEALGKAVERESDLATLGETLQRELTVQGYSAEKIREIHDQTVARLQRRNRLELVPGGVLDPDTTAYFLQREIHSNRRYKTYFSCIMMMIAQVREDGHAWRGLSQREVRSIMGQVFELLPLNLRELDLLGTLGTSEQNIPLIILPMTDQSKAEIVLERSLKALEGPQFQLGDDRVEARVVSTASSFDAESTPDMKAFLQAMRGKLATQVVTRLK